MDIDSPEKAVEGIKEEEGSTLVDNPELHLTGNKGEQSENFMNESQVSGEGIQVYLDQDYCGSHILEHDIENDGLQYPDAKSNVADLSTSENKYEDLNDADIERRISEYSAEGHSLSIDDYQTCNDPEGAEGGLLDNSANEIFNNEFQTEDSSSLPHNSLLTGNNMGNFSEMMGDEAFTHQIAESPRLTETENVNEGNASLNFNNEKAEVEENGGMVWQNSSLHSPERPENASPSPERPFSISAERSPHTHLSQEEGVPLQSNVDKKPSTSPTLLRRKRSSSLEKQREGRKKVLSSHVSSPSRRRSPERTTHLDSRNRNISPRRHTASSPQRRDSPRKRGRSLSRSPTRKRESPGKRRDQSRRSRSRSPHARDRYKRSPRRRHSPRPRSPRSSYSRRRSPRRPWSPPRNRNSGLGKPGNNLFVAGFSYVTTERDLEKKFSRFGRVTDVRIVRDRRSGESRGFGFLSLERDQDADAAIRAVDQTEWNGRIVLVEKSKTPTR